MSAANNSNSKPDLDDENMFQAARSIGRRNAFGDLGEQIHQANAAIQAAEVDQMMPNFQSMTIKQ